MNWVQHWIMFWIQEESVSEQADEVVFFTIVNSMDNQDGSGKPSAIWHKQESRHTKILGHAFKIECLCAILKLAEQKRLQVYQTRSNAVILHDALPVEFIERALCMKTKDQLLSKGKRDSKTACCS